MLEFIGSAVNKQQFPPTEKEIVFVGRSNVGKSSLINALYNQKIAYVGKKPGKTRLINFFKADNGAYTAVDVPGYGFARRSMDEAVAFGQMMDDYFSRPEKIRLVIMIVDARIGLSADDEDMKLFLEDRRIPFLIAANKIDKLSNNQLANNKRKLFADIGNIVYVSAEKKKNLEQLRQQIAEAIL